MKNQILNRVDLFSENKKIFDKAYKWDIEYMPVAAAAIVTAAGVLANTAKIAECEKILKKNTGWFSTLRGNSKIPLVAKMSMADDPEKYLNKVMNIYDLMTKDKLKGGEYRIIAAIAFADNVELNNVDDYILKTSEIYKKMAREHSILTSAEDIPFAALLSLMDKDVDWMIDDMEKSFTLLKKKFFSKDPVQSLTHILTLSSDTPEVKCEKVMNVFDGLKDSKHAFGTGHELCALGTTALTSLSAQTLIDLICMADDAITEKKCLGAFSFGKAERRLFALQMVMSVCLNDSNTSDSATLTSMLASTIAIETCMLICTIAATDAATVAATSAAIY